MQALRLSSASSSLGVVAHRPRQQQQRCNSIAAGSCRRPAAPQPLPLAGAGVASHRRRRLISIIPPPTTTTTSAAATSTSSTHTSIPPLQPNHGALIVGGGPAGVAAAIMLSKLRGWSGVTIVERSHDLSWADPDRSYVYGVDGRGVRCAEMLGVGSELLAAGVDITSVPLTRVGRDGKANTRMVGTKDPNVATYWMPRASLMKVLVGGLEGWNKQSPSKQNNQVEVLTSSRVVAVERDRSTGRVAVTVEVGKSRDKKTLYPSLVLGCDGINSVVRKALERWAKEDGKGEDQAPTFSLRSYPSPAAGLKFKVLRLPPNPKLQPTKGDDSTTLRNPSFAVLVGSYKGRPLRMGLLPVRDESMGRTGNIITPPDHPFWQSPPQGDAAACRAALAEAFPQADWDALVPEDVMRAFAESEGGVFPAPQASDGVAYVLEKGGGGEAAPSATAVLLVGDAAHAFPPDLGQGVNAALQDVQALERHLSENSSSSKSSPSSSLATAARAYGADRAPEADALAKLVSFGYPYQYQQSPVRAKVWMLGFLARLALSKLTLGVLVAPPAFMLVQNTRLRYGEVLAKSRATTARLWGVFLLGVVALLGAWVLSGGRGAALRAAVGAG